MKQFFNIIFLVGCLLQINICRGENMSISVASEIALFPGEAFEPTELVKDYDNKIIVTGSWSGAKTGVVTKIDEHGKSAWIYRSKRESVNLLDNAVMPVFVGAVPMKNGEILVCGNDTFTDISDVQSGMGKKTKVIPKIIRLNGDGNLLAELRLPFSSELNFHFRGIEKCGGWGDGSYILGSGMRVLPYIGDATKPHRNKIEFFLWIARLDLQGKATWEKLISIGDNIPTNLNGAQLLNNGDLVFGVVSNCATSQSGGNNCTELIKISSHGEVVARHKLNGAARLIRRTSIHQPLALLLNGMDDVEQKIIYLDSSLAEVGQYITPKPRITNDIAYFNENKELVLFGWTTKQGRTTPSIANISIRDGKSDVFTFSSIDGDRYEIKDALALETPNVFAVTRQRISQSVPGNHFLLGITIIKLQ